MCRGAPTINYLLFANDNLIFCTTNTETSNNLLRILDMYAQASGQCINTENTIMIFSRNVGEMVKIESTTMWGYRILSNMSDTWASLLSLVGQRIELF